MIDYEKLKLAHELGEIYYNKTGESAYIEFSICFGCRTDNFKLYINQTLQAIGSIDVVIKYLEDLTKEKPKPKYKVGDEVWCLADGEVFSFYVIRINGFKYSPSNPDSDIDDYFHETQLYPSKESLIQSQIDYWTILLNEEKSTCSEDVSMSPTFEGPIKGFRCQHKTDGFYYLRKEGLTIRSKHLDFGLDFHNSEYKCKKCGGFYR